MATIQPSDVLPVRSRVSWGAILAGAFIALAVFILLGALGTALGITVADRVEDESLAMGAGIWAAAALLIALFVGGIVVSRCTVGETKMEAVLYGGILWGVVCSMLAVAGASLVSTGLETAMRMANAPAAVAVNRVPDDKLIGYGMTKENIAKYRAEMNETLRDPRTKAGVWWAFAALVFSIGAAICGAIVGAGPNLVLAAVRVRTTAVAVGDGPVRETTVGSR
jgi:hypothetical protein